MNDNNKRDRRTSTIELSWVCTLCSLLIDHCLNIEDANEQFFSTQSELIKF